MAASSAASPFSRARILTTLTSVQHTSALVFGSFLLVHLAAPSAAVVASHGQATDLATKTMILGRVYYQNALTEPLIVYGAATVHILAGVAKRILLARRRSSNETLVDAKGGDVDGRRAPSGSSTWSQVWRHLPSIHTLTGLALAPALLLHVALNRWSPRSTRAPIHELSPSELDYAYVTYGFQNGSSGGGTDGIGAAPPAWRYVTWAMYAVLLGAGAVHVVSGTDRIAQRAAARRRAKVADAGANTDGDAAAAAVETKRAAMRRLDKRRSRQRKALATTLVSFGGVAWLTVGLARMANEDGGVTGYTAKRVRACYAAVWPYSALS